MSKPKSVHTTHRKRLARALAAAADLTYAQALTEVTAASEAGRLPSRLDDAGMAAALRTLTANQTVTVSGPDGRATPGHPNFVAATLQERLAAIMAAEPGQEQTVRTEALRVGDWLIAHVADGPYADGPLCVLGRSSEPYQGSSAISGFLSVGTKGAQEVSLLLKPDERLQIWRPTAATDTTTRPSVAALRGLRSAGHFDGDGSDADPVRPEILDRAIARLLGGPYTSRVHYGPTNRRQMPRCDVCGRRLVEGEPWWLVADWTRGWANGAGAVCGRHGADRLPIHTEDGSIVEATEDSGLPEGLAAGLLLGQARFYVDIPARFATKDHPFWGRPVPEFAGGHVVIETRGDQYAAQAAASRVLGDHGWGGIHAAEETGAPERVHGLVIDHVHGNDPAVGGDPDCLGCQHAAKFAPQDRSSAAFVNRMRDREPYVGEGADGARRSARIDRSEADGLDTADPRHDDLLASAQAWEAQADRLAAASAPSEEIDRALFGGPFGPPHAFLERCAPGDETNLLAVASNLAGVPRVETWWYPIGTDGAAIHAIRKPKSSLTGGGDLAFVDSPEGLATESLDWQHLGPRARVHPDGLGVTFLTVDGVPSRTHRALFADEPVSDLAAVQRARVDQAEERAEREGDIEGQATHMLAADEETEAWLTEGEAAAAARASWRVAHEGNPVDRCTGSSWRDKRSKRDPLGYGPGGYNRCVKAAGHAPADGGTDPHHVDEWGHVFLLEPRFRVVRRVENDEMAAIAREAGMHVSDGSDMQPVSTFPPRQNTLWVTGGKGAQVEIVKVSNIYEDEQRLTAQVVHPVPPRTTVRSYTVAEVRGWRAPTDAEVRRYEKAWGLED